MRRLAAASWLAISLPANALAEAAACPSGTTLNTQELPDQGLAETCVDDEGKLDGPARLFRAGVLRREDTWRRGVPHGLSTIYDERGVKREERSYQAGLLQGKETYFHANGRRKSVTQYQLGQKSGAIGEWDEAGRQRVAGQFELDRAAGIWLFAPPDAPAHAKVFADGEAATPLGLERGCTAWREASDAQRDQLAADLALLSIRTLEREPSRPLGDLDPFGVRHCMISRTPPIVEALDADCSAGTPELIGTTTTERVAELAAKCVVVGAAIRSVLEET